VLSTKAPPAGDRKGRGTCVSSLPEIGRIGARVAGRVTGSCRGSTVRLRIDQAAAPSSVLLWLIIAFIILAAYTYTSGLRAPAMIALVKDTMIFVVLFVAIIYIPMKLGGFGPIFAAAHAKAVASQHLATTSHPPTAQTFFDILSPKQFPAYVTLALGSALALFLYPHSLTGVLSSNSAQVVKRNTALLPIYSLMLGFLALLGYMAIAAKVIPLTANLAVPALLNYAFPSWFIGFAPADAPRIAIAVIMEHQGSGSDFATPAAQSVMRTALTVYK